MPELSLSYWDKGHPERVRVSEQVNRITKIWNTSLNDPRRFVMVSLEPEDESFASGVRINFQVNSFPYRSGLTVDNAVIYKKGKEWRFVVQGDISGTTPDIYKLCLRASPFSTLKEALNYVELALEITA